MESNGDVASIFEGVLNDLFNILNDKDESVRHAVELSLIKIVEKRTDESLLAITEHKIKYPKLSEQATSILLRVIENVTTSGIDVNNYETYNRVINMAIDELTKSNDHNPIIQKPALEILVSIGRNHCDMVMRELISATKEGYIPHFMIMNCMGTLATANVMGIAPFIKIVLGNILPNLNAIKQDHVKQAHAFAIGRFCEALLEGPTDEKSTEVDKSCTTEISVVYDVFINQWIHSREPKVCVEILQAMSNMYQLLSQDKIQEQSIKIVSILLNLYRRSIDRNAITQFLASVIKTNLKYFPKSMDTIIDVLLTHLFDLVCVYPDYEKPQTVKGHYEVLRCFYLLSNFYSIKIMDMILLHLRNNHERERIKALLVFTHLTNTSSNCIEMKLNSVIDVLKQLIVIEKQIKMKMTLLKTIVALAQKSFIKDKEFVWFIVRHSCKYNKMNHEYGTTDEYNDFVQSCKNSLYILSSTVGTMDELLKRELLNYFLLLDYTDVSSLIMKCLSYLFAKNPSIEYDVTDATTNTSSTKLQGTASNSLSSDFDDDEYEDDDDGENNKKYKSKQKSVPSSEEIFTRCITMMGNHNEGQKISNILNFLKYYSVNIHKDINKLWDSKISELMLCTDKEKLFIEKLYNFVKETVEFFDNNNTNGNGNDNENNENNVNGIKSTEYAERLITKLSEQLILYPVNVLTNYEFYIPSLNIERGMILKLIGLILCYTNDEALINKKIDLIINTVKNEKLDKNHPNSEYEYKLIDASISLGFISRKHLKIVLNKLQQLSNQYSGKKHSNNFFMNLNFIKDTHKEIETYKINLLIFESYGHIIENSNPNEILKDIDHTMINQLLKQLHDTKDQTMKKIILNTLLTVCLQFIKNNKDCNYELKTRNDILKQILNIPIESPTFDNLPLFPIILKLATNLLKIECDDDKPYKNDTIGTRNTTSNNNNNSNSNSGTSMMIDDNNVHNFLSISCRNFFSCAQNLKTKFESQEDDERNSFLAQYLNLSLPELNNLVKIIIENDPSPSCLDNIITILEYWIKNNNSEVRICAGHVMNNLLECYIKSMKIGCEAPSKFNQTGQMLGKIVPRCIDSNATVRQTSVDILQKILEIACIYETLTIADNNVDWVKNLEKIREDIITDDPKEIYQLAGDIAKIIALRLANFQYLQFCKTLLHCLDDPEQSSSIGSSVVLKFFIQQKGAELFHAIPDLVKESLCAIKNCEIIRAKSGVLKSLVALTKHHPKLVCNEMLAQPLPFNEAVIEYWQTICIDLELTGTILENFLIILSSSCLYESNESKDDTRQKIATTQPFAIFCALKEIFPSKEIHTELKYKFPELFTMLLTSLATYTNLAPPMLSAKYTSSSTTNSKDSQQYIQGGKTKYGFIPNKDAVKLNPCQVIFDAFHAFLINLELEQIANVLTVCPNLTTSTDLSNFIEILTPMAVAIVNQFTILSSTMKQIVTSLSKYVSSPYDGQRIAAIGLYSQFVPLKPCGEISSVIMLHLSSALSDPNPIVRGLSIRGLAFVGNLTEHDIEKYSETAITALLKGIDDYNNNCLINIPLESKRGLSRILQTLPKHKVESFHISLAIRIRPFFENSSTEIREAAIILFGDLCESKLEDANDGTASPSCSSEALREQLYANFVSLLLHLSENDPIIIRACKVTLRKVCALLDAPKANEMAQKHLLEHGQLNYNVFVIDFVKAIGSELTEHLQDFIESCIPFLKSHWSEIRGNAAVIIGILNNFLQVHNQQTEHVGHKLALLLKDDNATVRLKAATALGYFFGDI